MPAIEAIPVAEARAGLARARLVMNVLEGKDRAVQSIKLMGQDKEVIMFEPEVRTGTQTNVSLPAEWHERYVQPAPKES